MMTGLSSVSARKCLRSDLTRHGKALPRPITPFSAIAATMRMSGMEGAIGCSSGPHIAVRKNGVASLAYVAGHPRPNVGAKIKDVDGRVKPGHSGYNGTR